MTSGLVWKRIAILGGVLSVAGSASMACGSTTEDPAGDDAGVTDISSGGRTPGGGGPTSGGAFNSSGDTPTRPTASSSSGRSGSSGSSGGESSSGSSSSGSGEPGCDDPNDAPNDDAQFIAPFTVGGDSILVPGVLAGANDTDWYAYDLTGNVPNFGIFIAVERPEVELCVFTECEAGTVAITCDGGATTAVDKYGSPGCCAQGTATSQAYLAGNATCNGSTADQINAYVSVSSKAPQCEPYNLRVGF